MDDALYMRQMASLALVIDILGNDIDTDDLIEHLKRRRTRTLKLLEAQGQGTKSAVILALERHRLEEAMLTSLNVMYTHIRTRCAPDEFGTAIKRLLACVDEETGDWKPKAKGPFQG